MTNRWSPRGLKALLERLVAGSQLDGATVVAMVVTSGSTVGNDAEWDAADYMTGFTTLNELAPVQRKGVSGVALAVDTGGESDEVVLTFDPVTWVAPAGPDGAYVVVTMKEAGAPASPSLAGRVPILRLDAPQTWDGTDWTFVPLPAGAARAETAG